MGTYGDACITKGTQTATLVLLKIQSVSSHPPRRSFRRFTAESFPNMVDNSRREQLVAASLNDWCKGLMIT